MSLNCVHGIPPTHCSQCRTCPHGMATSACGRCANAVMSRAAANALPPPMPAEEHRGYEIFFVPQDQSWYYRDDPAAPLPRTSYRSAFQARRAINATLDDPAPAKPEPVRKRR